MNDERFERRFFTAHDLEIRADEGDTTTIEGYAAVFNQRSDDLGGFVEIVAPGAFAQSLNEEDVRALSNHNHSQVLGRKSAGTLELFEDAHGLRVRIDPPETQWANDLLASMRRGDIDQMSFGFFTRDDKWEVVDGLNVRTLLNVELFEVSVVTIPAYPQTSVSVRSKLTELSQVANSDDDIKPNLQGQTAAKKLRLNFEKQRI